MNPKTKQSVFYTNHQVNLERITSWLQHLVEELNAEIVAFQVFPPMAFSLVDGNGYAAIAVINEPIHTPSEPEKEGPVKMS